MSGSRLIAVLGYSNGRGHELHEICVRRLRRAEQEARAEDVVLLSGWARGRRAASEAELMARAWSGRASRIVVDHTARTTAGNVAGAAAAARQLSTSEVVLVTSSWHGKRAAALLHAALDGTGARVSLAVTDEPVSVSGRLREAACWAAVPFQRAAVRARSRARARSSPC
jgi:uncharacterized SAM-binding protein YcdF (DUF218 family)